MGKQEIGEREAQLRAMRERDFKRDEAARNAGRSRDDAALEKLANDKRRAAKRKVKRKAKQ